MLDGVTGVMVRGNDVRSLHYAMVRLLDAGERSRMGQAARTFSEANRVDKPFTAVLDSEAHRRQLRKEKRLQDDRDRRQAADLASVVQYPS